MNRRGFLAALSSAVVFSATGLSLIPSVPEVGAEVAKVRHMWAYGIYDDWIHHRLDVRIGRNGYSVDFVNHVDQLNEECMQHAMRTLDMTLAEHHENLALGEVRTFGPHQMHEMLAWWNA